VTRRGGPGSKQKLSNNNEQLHITTPPNDVYNIISVQVNGKGFYDCLIDSGAVKSCLSECFVKQLGLLIKPLRPIDNTLFIVANSKPVYVKGITEISLTIGNVEYTHTFHVLNNLSTDFLVGTDFLIANNGIINYETRTFSLDKNLVQVPLRKRGDNLGMAIVAETITIPPNSQGLVHILSSRRSPHSLTLIEPLDNENARGIRVARTLVRSLGSKHCPIWNDSDDVITLHKHTPIGTLSSISDILDSTDETGQFLPKPKHTFKDLGITLTNEKLTPQQKLDFENLVNDYGDVFALSNSELEGTDVLQYEIHVSPDARPIRQKPYNQSEKARNEIRKQIQELLDIKFIRRSVSPWAANCLLVKKANGTYRMCVDYRLLNRSVIPEIHAVPTFTCIADTLSYARPTILTSLDLRSGFHNLKVAESSVKYTGFQTFMGQFEYLRAPYGIQNIPAAMQRVMNHILSEDGGPLMKYALCYLDDLLIFSPSVDAHMLHLQEVFRRLRKSKMKLNPSKCVFLVP
jgi:hypothetical protein